MTPDNDATWWSDSSGRMELQIKREDYTECSKGGRDAEPYVSALMAKPYISSQLARLQRQHVRDNLREYGAWSDEELADHTANLQRTVWLACCDLNEWPEEQE